MFNTNNTYAKSISNNNLNINAITGTILKNYKDSFFLRFQLKSRIGENLLNQKPTLKTDSYPYEDKDAVVIQMMMCGDMDVIAELMWKEDFDKLDENGGNNNE
jgi:hypothetical protein